MLQDICLTIAESFHLAHLLHEQVKEGKAQRGDGFAYKFEYDMAYDHLRKSLSPEYAIMKIMAIEKENHQYVSFETWFPSAMNLCQTRVYYDGNLRLRIGMADGWTEEVHANVLERLKELGVRE